MTSTEQLIERLAGEAPAVRPLASPGKRAARWLALCALVIASAVALMGLRPGLAAAMAVPVNAMEWVAAVLTGVLASYAVFQVSIPGRSAHWAWLPAPALAAWIASLGWGCLGEASRLGLRALAFDTQGAHCFVTILGIGAPLLVLLMYLVRHAGPTRPVSTALLAALSTAALASAGVSLVHGGDTALMVLLWHVGAVAVLMLAMASLGRRWFAWTGRGGRARRRSH